MEKNETPPAPIEHPLETACEDKRPIKRITWVDESFHEVGHSCDRIEAYEEPGGLGPMLFLAIWEDGAITSRIPAHQVVISYRTGAESEEAWHRRRQP